MQTLVLFIMLLVCFICCLKQTFLKPWQVGLFALCYAVFTGFAWRWSCEQSRGQIEIWLADAPLMLDTSVVVTVEAAWQMAYCLLSARLMHAGRVRRRTVWLYRVLRFFPGVLILAVLMAAQVSLMYLMAGVDFAVVSWSMAAVVAVLLPALSWGIRWLLPEKPLRLELLFLASALLLLLGIVATVNGTTNFAGSDAVEWPALLADVALLAVCACIGYYQSRFKIFGRRGLP